MRSYVVTEWGQPMECREQKTPVPTGREVLIRVTAAGVCHSDLHIHDGFYDMGGGKRLTNDQRAVFTPLTMGHEIAGVVEAMGSAATGLTMDEPVAVYPWIGCGTCDACALGEEQNCPNIRTLGIMTDGGYATHVLVPEAKYCLPLHGLSPEVAALYACSGLTTWHALKKIDPRVLQSEPILIIGAGGLGLMALTLLDALGARGAIVVELDPAKRAAAQETGAIATIDPRADDALLQIKEASAHGRGVRAAIDLVGTADTMQLAIDAQVKGGQVIVVGLMGGEITLPIPSLPARALTIEGSYVGTLEEMKALMGIAREQGLPAPPIETHPLEDAQLVLNNLRSGKVHGRGVLVP